MVFRARGPNSKFLTMSENQCKLNKEKDKDNRNLLSLMSNLQPQATGTRTKINEPSSVMFEPAEAPPPQETAMQHDNESTKNEGYSTESSNLFESSEQTSTYHVPNLSSTEFERTESSEGTLDPLQETGLLGSAHGAPDGTDTSIEDSEQPPLFSIQEE